MFGVQCVWANGIVGINVCMSAFVCISCCNVCVSVYVCVHICGNDWPFKKEKFICLLKSLNGWLKPLWVWPFWTLQFHLGGRGLHPPGFGVYILGQSVELIKDLTFAQQWWSHAVGHYYRTRNHCGMMMCDHQQVTVCGAEHFASRALQRRGALQEHQVARVSSWGQE